MWKECKECSMYEVSDEGDIRSKYTGKILKQKLNAYNMLMIDLHSNGKRKSYTVHRLVAEAFVPNPDNLDYIKHIDGNLLNNNATNLTWVKTHGPYIMLVTPEQIQYCRKVYKPRDKQFGCTALAKKFNVSLSTMYRLLHDPLYGI